MSVKAKKHLGQHFLTDENIAKKIANSLQFSGYDKVLEVGPGMGVLTKYLLEKETETFVAEIDTESIAYLKEHYPQLKENHFVGDFLKTDFSKIFPNEQVAVIGNFPYNISSQILFQIIENYQQNVFNPPPKVKSGVTSLLRNPKEGLAGNETLFKNIVKAGFNQRRKKLSNALKVLNIPEGLFGHNFLNLRAEELSVQDFISFTNEWKENLK